MIIDFLVFDLFVLWGVTAGNPRRCSGRAGAAVWRALTVVCRLQEGSGRMCHLAGVIIELGTGGPVQ